jgi:hypothetical protein
MIPVTKITRLITSHYARTPKGSHINHEQGQQREPRRLAIVWLPYHKSTWDEENEGIDE